MSLEIAIVIAMALLALCTLISIKEYWNQLIFKCHQNDQIGIVCRRRFRFAMAEAKQEWEDYIPLVYLTQA